MAGITTDRLAFFDLFYTPFRLPAAVGGGFRAEMFVKPFAGQGPYLKPGIGAANLIADIDGKRMQAQRDLTASQVVRQMIRDYLDFVTLASTADIVPLVGENRILSILFIPSGSARR